MSSFYLVKGDFNKAIDYAQKLLVIEKLKSNHRERLMAYRNIKDAYRFLKDDAQENKYLRLYTKLNDSITFAEKKAIVNQSRDEIKKADVKNEQSKKTFLSIGGIIVLFIALGAWLFVRRNNKIMRKNYEQMIIKLKSEAILQSAETNEGIDELNIDNEVEAGTNEESELSANRNLISTETESRLLKKLSSFEKSGRFLRKDLTIGMLSGQLNTNSKYLSEIINKNKSQNFSNYINSLRIHYIIHKLYNEPKYREYKISYLAEECGFASPQVFVLAFKKANGVTPSYFIQSLKEDEVLLYN